MALCTRCQNPLKPGKRFCTKCGEPVPFTPSAHIEISPEAETLSANASLRRCLNCRAVIEPGNKFCIKCGALVIAPAPSFTAESDLIIKVAKPAQPLCSRCHAPLKSGKRFCVECGNPVATEIQETISQSPVKKEKRSQKSESITPAEIIVAGDVYSQRQGFGPRFIAALLDSVILLVLIGGAQFITGLKWLPPILIAAYYFLEVIFGRSFGKRISSLMVLNEAGTRAGYDSLKKRWQLKVGIPAFSNLLMLAIFDIAPSSPLLILTQLPSLLVAIGSLSIFGAAKQTFYDRAAKTAVFKVQYSGSAVSDAKNLRQELQNALRDLWRYLKTQTGVFDAQGKFSVEGAIRLPFRIIQSRLRNFVRGFLVGGGAHFLAVALSGGYSDVASFPTSLLIPTIKSSLAPVALAIWTTGAALISYFLNRRKSKLTGVKLSAYSIWWPWIIGLGWLLLTNGNLFADDSGLSEIIADGPINSGAAALLGQSGITGFMTGIGAGIGAEAGLATMGTVMVEPPSDAGNSIDVLSSLVGPSMSSAYSSESSASPVIIASSSESSGEASANASSSESSVWSESSSSSSTSSSSLSSSSSSSSSSDSSSSLSNSSSSGSEFSSSSSSSEISSSSSFSSISSASSSSEGSSSSVSSISSESLSSDSSESSTSSRRTEPGYSGGKLGMITGGIVSGSPPVPEGVDEKTESKKAPGGINVTVKLKWDSVRGDEKDYTIAVATVTPVSSEDWVSSVKINFTASTGTVEDGSSAEAKIISPWSKEDSSINVTANVTADVKSPSGVTASRSGQGTATVKIIGANPNLVLKADTDRADADGSSRITIYPLLYLFNQEMPYTSGLEVANQNFDRTYFEEDSITEKDHLSLRCKFHLEGEAAAKKLETEKFEIKMGVKLTGEIAARYPNVIDSPSGIKVTLKPSRFEISPPSPKNLPTGELVEYKTRLIGRVVSGSGIGISGQTIQKDRPGKFYQNWRFTCSYEVSADEQLRAWDSSPGKWPAAGSDAGTVRGVNDSGYLEFLDKAANSNAPWLDYDHWEAFYDKSARYLKGQCCQLKVAFERDNDTVKKHEIFIGPPCKIYVYVDRGGPKADEWVGHVYPGLINEKGRDRRLGFFMKQPIYNADEKKGVIYGATGYATVAGLALQGISYLFGLPGFLARTSAQVVAVVVAGGTGAVSGGIHGIGKMEDDKGHGYHVCRSWDITKAEYDAAAAEMNYWLHLHETNQLLYDASAKTPYFMGNCVSFTYDICTKAGIQLPFGRSWDLSRPTNVDLGINQDPRREDNPGYGSTRKKGEKPEHPWIYTPPTTGS